MILQHPRSPLVAHISEYGANMYRLSYQEQGVEIALLDGYPEDSDLLRSQPHYKGSKLFPFANRIKDGRYGFRGNSYQLHTNETARQNAMHGLVWAAPFALTSQGTDADHAWVSYELLHLPTEDTAGAADHYAGYPFAFSLKVTYRLLGNELQCETRVCNLSPAETLPFTDGWHPYFCLSTNAIDELYLQLPPADHLPTDDRMIPTGEKYTFSDFTYPEPIGQRHFDTGFCLHTALPSCRHYTRLQNPAKGMVLSIWQDAAYGYLQVYTPKHRQSIAIEPMSGAPDALNNQMGLTLLDPEQIWTGTYGITVANS